MIDILFSFSQNQKYAIGLASTLGSQSIWDAATDWNRLLTRLRWDSINGPVRCLVFKASQKGK